MTAATVTAQQPNPAPVPQSTGRAPDLTSARGISWPRLIAMEIRKGVNTRSSLGLLIAAVAATAVALIMVMILERSDGAPFGMVMWAATQPQAILIPIVGILLITSEWSQRTVMSTYTQEPRRFRVSVAKVVAALVLGLIVIAVTIPLALGTHPLSAALAGGSVDFEHIGTLLSAFLIAQVLFALHGVALGALFLNAPVAIVTYFAVPTVVGMLQMADWFSNLHPWIDLTFAIEPLYDAASLTGEQWSQLGTATSLWVIVPLAIGLLRIQRKEVK